MAFLKLFERESTGEQYLDAYWKVTDVLLSATGQGVRFSVDTYKDTAARQANKQPINHDQYLVTGNDWTTYFANEVLEQPGANPFRQAYLWLKAQKPFESAKDV